MDYWDLIGFTGIILVVGTLLVFGRSLLGPPAPGRSGTRQDGWSAREGSVARLPRIPLTRRDAL